MKKWIPVVAFVAAVASQPAHGSTAMATTEFLLRLNFVPNAALTYTPHGGPIGGTLDGYGFHEERWGLLANGASPQDGISFVNYEYPDTFSDIYGEHWATQAVVSPSSWWLSMFVDTFASHEPISYAMAKSWAETGSMMEVYNPTDQAQSYTFTISGSLFSDVVAVADPGDAASARASWDFGVTQKTGGILDSLVDLKGERAVSASLGLSNFDIVSISALTESNDKVATYTKWLNPGEHTEFSLTRASLFAEAVAVPEPASVVWFSGMATALVLAVFRRRIRR